MNVDISITQTSDEQIHKKLLEWWPTEKRNFPWRNSKDPYHILIAEILLHRTRAEQVIPIYIDFLKSYPSLHSLAEVKAEDLKSRFHSAGLHWRWDLMVKMIHEIYLRFNGEIPHDMEDLISLPGISRYIASAVRCFAFGYPEVIMDTNTVRVAGRLYGLPVIDSSRRDNKFKKALHQMIDSTNSRDFNFALLDFAAKVCTARNPACVACPINKFCEYYKNNNQIN
ncbi:MAG: DNA-binding protein [Deltaproteobacteria bacterium]|nr:DNA-binding protein [Deltaproteobacteria bacterium]